MNKKILIVTAMAAIGQLPVMAIDAPGDTAAVVTAAETTQATASPTATATLRLSLDNCLTIALSDNPTVKVADMDVVRTDYSRMETVSQLLPSVTFSGTYNRTLAKQVAYMNMDFDDMFGGLGGIGGGSTTDPDNPGDAEGDTTPTSRASSSSSKKNDGIKMGLDNSYQVGFSASMPLIAPQLWASLKLSDTQILEANEKARASRIDLVNQVKNAYYALMLAMDSRRVLQESYDMAAYTHNLYVKQQQLGAASDFDVLRTSVAMKNIEPSLLQADIAIKQAKLQLKILTGIDSGTDFDITGTLSDYEKTMYDDVLSIDPDYSHNTSLVQFDIQTRQLQQLVKIEKASYYPTVAANFNYMWTSSTNGTPFSFRWTPYSMVGLSLNVPLFNGGKRYARIKQAEIQLGEAEYTRLNLERNIAMQVDLAVDNIKLNVGQIASSSESVAQASRAHDIQVKSFNIGATSYLNLRDSELALTQSQLAFYQSVYNYLVARSQLEYLLGSAAPFTEYQRMRN